MCYGKANIIRPQIHRSTTIVTNYISAIHLLINGGFRHTDKKVQQKERVVSKDALGNPILDASGHDTFVDKDIWRRLIATHPLPTNTEKFQALHPFPNPSYPMNAGGGMAAGMAGTLLRKRLEPMEEGWVEDKIRKAGEWLYVPEEWGVDMKKPNARADKQDGEEEEEEEDGVPESERLDSEAIPTKRVKDALSGEAIKDLWQHAHQEVFDLKYLRRTYPASYPTEGAQEANEDDDEEGDEEEGDEEEEEEEFEDVMDTSGGQEEGKEDESRPKLMKKKVLVGKLPVHQPMDGVPVLSLGVVHRFAEIGEV